MKVPAHWKRAYSAIGDRWYERETPPCTVRKEGSGVWHVYLKIWKYPGDTYLPTFARAIEEADRRIEEKGINYANR
jgi:hypothetical protein